MGGVTDAISGSVGGWIGGDDDVGDASKDASRIQASAQRDALDYLKEREELPQQLREGALTQLAGQYGLEGGEGDQQALIDRAIESPIYQAIMGGQKAGEESIMRNASMTGGLRSGNVQHNLYDYNTQLQNNAMLTSYNQQLTGLQGMANLPSNANTIAQGTAGIGQTIGQGIIGAEQSSMGAKNQQQADLMQMAGVAAMAFSDIRLKENIKHLGERNGHKWFSWDWNKIAGNLGLKGGSEGVMAHMVHEYQPDAIGVRDGYITVNYEALGVQ